MIMLLCDNKIVSISARYHISTAYRIEFLTLPIFHYPSSLLWTLVTATGDHLRLALTGNRLSVYRNFAASGSTSGIRRPYNTQTVRVSKSAMRGRRKLWPGGKEGGEPAGSQYFVFIALLSRN